MAQPLLEITPETELTFKLSHKEATPRCVLSMRNPGTTGEFIAFKVKTTQPKRYLVRPNQGLIAPNSKEDVSILLIEKDKQSLLQTYERLGQSGLDNSVDKFLVQSCIVDSAFGAKAVQQKASGASDEVYAALGRMWDSVSGKSSTKPVHNKKLHVKHLAQDAAASATSRAAVPSPSFAPAASSKTSLENMTPDQLKEELTHLRRKYDELVSFSVNLTAERDIMSNTLEQTKREYNRELSARSALENKHAGGSSGASGSGAKSASAPTSLPNLLGPLLAVALACFLGGLQFGSNHPQSVRSIPIFGKIIGPPPLVKSAVGTDPIPVTEEPQ